nr:hypothetical protein [Streptomyces halobius]
MPILRSAFGYPAAQEGGDGLLGVDIDACVGFVPDLVGGLFGFLLGEEAAFAGASALASGAVGEFDVVVPGAMATLAQFGACGAEFAQLGFAGGIEYRLP